jgi:hypothetical protein
MPEEGIMQKPFSVIRRYAPVCDVSADHVHITCPVCDRGILGKAHGSKPQAIPLSNNRTATKTAATCSFSECASNNIADADDGYYNLNILVYDCISTVVEVERVGAQQ